MPTVRGPFPTSHDSALIWYRNILAPALTSQLLQRRSSAPHKCCCQTSHFLTPQRQMYSRWSTLSRTSSLSLHLLFPANEICGRNYWTHQGGLAEVVGVLPSKEQADMSVARPPVASFSPYISKRSGHTDSCKDSLPSTLML